MSNSDYFVSFLMDQAFAKALDLTESKVYNNIQRYGNTTAASISPGAGRSPLEWPHQRRQYRHVPGFRLRRHLGGGAVPIC